MPTTPSPVKIVLSETNRSRLQKFIHCGHTSARPRTHAQVLLKLGADWSEVEVCEAFDVCRNTIKGVLARFRDGRVDRVDEVLTDRNDSPVASREMESSGNYTLKLYFRARCIPNG